MIRLVLFTITVLALSACSSAPVPKAPSFTQLVDGALQYSTPEAQISALQALQPVGMYQHDTRNIAIAKIAILHKPEQYQTLAAPLYASVQTRIKRGQLYLVPDEAQRFAALSAQLAGERLALPQSIIDAMQWCDAHARLLSPNVLNQVNWYAQRACGLYLLGNTRAAMNQNVLAINKLKILMHNTKSPVPSYLVPVDYPHAPYAIRVLMTRAFH